MLGVNNNQINSSETSRELQHLCKINRQRINVPKYLWITFVYSKFGPTEARLAWLCLLPGRDECGRSEQAFGSVCSSGPRAEMKCPSITEPGLTSSLELTDERSGKHVCQSIQQTNKWYKNQTPPRKQLTFLCHSRSRKDSQHFWPLLSAGPTHWARICELNLSCQMWVRCVLLLTAVMWPRLQVLWMWAPGSSRHGRCLGSSGCN